MKSLLITIGLCWLPISLSHAAELRAGAAAVDITPRAYPINMPGGRSANLASSGNIEQLCVEDNPALFDFNMAYLQPLLERYNVLNQHQPDIRRQKCLSISNTWQPTPEDKASETFSSSTPTEPAADQPPPAAPRSSLPSAQVRRTPAMRRPDSATANDAE